MRKWLVLGLVLFPAALGVVAGLRLPVESLAVVVGVMFGVGASLPLFLVALFLLRKGMVKEDRPQNYPQPPVIVINPGGGFQHPQPPLYLPPSESNSWEEPRYFRIIGEDWKE